MVKLSVYSLVENLEARRLLIASPTAAEQYELELINRGRANPSAEAARYGTALNEGLPAGTISTADKQPLAFNPDLIDSARDHSQWMLRTNTFSHTGAGGTNPDDRMRNAGYSLAGYYGWAENIAWISHGGSAVDTGSLDAIHANLYIDTPEADRGHRINLMNPDLKEVGIGSFAGNFDGYNAVMTTEDYGYHAGDSFLTGVAYNDAVSADHFYEPGEGLGGVQVVATSLSDRSTYSVSTWDSGGYSLALPAGTYRVQASGGRLNGTVVYDDVVIGSQNVKLDYRPDMVASGSGGTGGGGGSTSGTGSGSGSSTTPPTAALARRRYAYVSQNGHYFAFTVTFTGANPIDASSLGNLQVTGPKKFTGTAALGDVQSLNGGDTLVGTYWVKRPKGVWSSVDAGSYAVALPGHQVHDTAGSYAASATLGAEKLVIATTATVKKKAAKVFA